MKNRWHGEIYLNGYQLSGNRVHWSIISFDKSQMLNDHYQVPCGVRRKLFDSILQEQLASVTMRSTLCISDPRL